MTRARAKAKLGAHPNAVVAGSSGGSAATLVLVLSAFGITLPLAAAVALVAVVPPVALFVGRRGIKGTLKALWEGVGGA